MKLNFFLFKYMNAIHFLPVLFFLMSAHSHASSCNREVVFHASQSGDSLSTLHCLKSAFRNATLNVVFGHPPACAAAPSQPLPTRQGAPLSPHATGRTREAHTGRRCAGAHPAVRLPHSGLLCAVFNGPSPAGSGRVARAGSPSTWGYASSVRPGGARVRV